MKQKPAPAFCSRRHFVRASAFSLGSMALASLLQDENLLAAPVKPFLGG